MTSQEALEWIRDQLEYLQARRPGCPDKTCTVCKRHAVEDRHTEEAFSVLEGLSRGEVTP